MYKPRHIIVYYLLEARFWLRGADYDEPWLYVRREESRGEGSHGTNKGV